MNQSENDSDAHMFRCIAGQIARKQRYRIWRPSSTERLILPGGPFGGEALRHGKRRWGVKGKMAGNEELAPNIKEEQAIYNSAMVAHFCHCQKEIEHA